MCEGTAGAAQHHGEHSMIARAGYQPENAGLQYTKPPPRKGSASRASTSPLSRAAMNLRKEDVTVAHKGKIQLTFVMVAPPDAVAEGDRLFQTHGPWMETTHHRNGSKALLSYDVSKAPELSNPFDPASAPTGNTCFILSEVYETEEGVTDHFAQAMSGWKDFPALGEWLAKCKVSGAPAAPIFNSLW